MKQLQETPPSPIIVAVSRFALGGIYITPAAQEVLSDAEITDFLNRHAACDWGDVCEQDREENDFALLRRLRLLSVYHSKQKEKVWVITEADRSLTTILLPSDY